MNDSWFLGTGKSPMSPVYGSLVPLSNSKNDLWVKKCARCNKGLNHDLTASPHRPIPTGGQTMWLAKLYVNDLLLTWKTDPSTMSRRPSVACAAQASYDDKGRTRYIYYIAGSSAKDVDVRTGVGLTLSATADEIWQSFWTDFDKENMGDWNLRLVKENLTESDAALEKDTKVLFADSVLTLQGGARQVAQALFGPLWTETMIAMRERAVENGKPNTNPRDPDGGEKFELLACTEQRVLLCHRLVKESLKESLNPDSTVEGLLKKADLENLGLLSAANLKLEQMTVALVDNHVSGSTEPFAVWAVDCESTTAIGLPVPPCNVCRVALPVLLCPTETENLPATPPTPEDVIIEVTR
jgi:hypothetical protein